MTLSAAYAEFRYWYAYNIGEEAFEAALTAWAAPRSPHPGYAQGFFSLVKNTTNGACLFVSPENAADLVRRGDYVRVGPVHAASYRQLRLWSEAV